MIWNSIQNRVRRNIAEYRDFHTKRQIVVFESDDWGSIRMSNKKDWNELLRMGYAVDKRPYEQFDTLESAEDLEALFEVLVKHKDRYGNHPVITANMLVANPDFERIEQSRFQEYSYEPIAKTYERYFGNIKTLELMRQGMEEGVFMPQNHGREHFNVTQWMKGIQARDEDLLTAFNFGMCGIAPKAHPEYGNCMMDALLAKDDSEQNKIDSIVDDGLRMFEDLWGFKSQSFVAPCYLWSKQTEQVLANRGVKLIQTSRRNKHAYKSSPRYFYAGQRNKYNQIYSIRNCKFEPATNEGGATIEDLMNQIDRIFAQQKLAVFSTHRINYVGSIDKNNRNRTLKLLDELLTELLQKYPNVEFKNSTQLLELFGYCDNQVTSK